MVINNVFLVISYSSYGIIFSCLTPLNVVKESIPDAYTLSVMIGDDLEMDTANSILMSASDQVSYVCDI
jgi:hypothetical protein